MFVFIIMTCLFIAALWSPAGKGLTSLGSLVYDVSLCFVPFPCGVSGHLIVSIPDLYLLLYFYLTEVLWDIFDSYRFFQDKDYHYSASHLNILK